MRRRRRKVRDIPARCKLAAFMGWTPRKGERVWLRKSDKRENPGYIGAVVHEIRERTLTLRIGQREVITLGGKPPPRLFPRDD